jgi:hypothetical protein
MNFAPRRQSNEIKEAGHSKSGEEVLVVEKRLVLEARNPIRMRPTSETPQAAGQSGAPIGQELRRARNLWAIYEAGRTRAKVRSEVMTASTAKPACKTAKIQPTT